MARKLTEKELKEFSKDIRIMKKCNRKLLNNWERIKERACGDSSEFNGQIRRR